MNKKILSISLFSLLLLSTYIPITSAHEAPFPVGYDYTAMTLDVTGNPESLDPAFANDMVSEAVIMNVYETLLFYDPLWTEGPYQPPLPAAQRISTFVPQLASALPTIDHTGGTNPVSGLHWYSKFTFPIRTGVKFHHGAFADPDGSGPLMGSDGIMKPSDVAYSIKRVLVQGRAAGPAWLLYEPLLNVEGAMPPVDDPDFGLKIDGAVQVDGNNVVFYLAGLYPDLAFEQILCQTCASVISEAWAANEDDLNMNLVTPIPPSTNPWSNWEYIYNQWWNPLLSFVEDAIDKTDPMKDGGTGPYRMSYWTLSTAWSIRKFDDYRGESIYGDLDNSGTVTDGDILLHGVGQPAGATLIHFVTPPPPAYAERHAENVIVNGLYDPGESIYRDVDLSGTVTPEDVWLGGGSEQPEGTVLIAFAANEKHAENIIINSKYEGGFPAPVPGSKALLGGYLDSITWYLVVNWPTRLGDLLVGQRDMVAVPRSYRDQVLGQEVGDEKIRSYYPITQLSASALYFTFNISPTAVPGYVPVLLAPGTFSEAGVPPNIFGVDTVTGKDEGMNVRKAFAAAWDYGYAISAGYLDEATQPASPVIDGLAYQNPAQPKPTYSLNKAEYYFKLAWGGIDDRSGVPSQPVLPEDPTHILVTGALWNGGMRMTTVWPTGEVAYMLAQEKMIAEINAMHPEGRFHLTYTDKDWGTVFLPDMQASRLPVFNMDKLADFADPHSFVQAFMHSQGTFGTSQVINITVTANGLRQVFVDELIGQGIVTPDTPATFTQPAGSTVADWFDDDGSGSLNTGDWAQISGNWYEKLADGSYKYDRQLIYYELEDVYVKYTPSTMVFQAIGRGFEVAWCRGFYDNKLFQGNYWYHWWKAKTHFGDVNWDGEVNILDWVGIGVFFTSPPGPGGFNPRADLTGGTAGTVGSGTGLVRGVPDGTVSVGDLAVVSAYWDNPPGPSHP